MHLLELNDLWLIFRSSRSLSTSMLRGCVKQTEDQLHKFQWFVVTSPQKEDHFGDSPYFQTFQLVRLWLNFCPCCRSWLVTLHRRFSNPVFPPKGAALRFSSALLVQLQLRPLPLAGHFLWSGWSDLGNIFIQFERDWSCFFAKIRCGNQMPRMKNDILGINEIYRILDILL